MGLINTEICANMTHQNYKSSFAFEQDKLFVGKSVLLVDKEDVFTEHWLSNDLG